MQRLTRGYFYYRPHSDIYTFDDVCPFIRAENTHCQVHVNGVNYANSPFDPASEWLTGEFGLYSKFDRFLLTI